MPNRVASWTDKGIVYEADPRHAELMIKEFQLQDSKDVVTQVNTKRARQQKRKMHDWNQHKRLHTEPQ